MFAFCYKFYSSTDKKKIAGKALRSLKVKRIASVLRLKLFNHLESVNRDL